MQLERKDKEVGKLIEETQKSMNDLAENINQATVSSQKDPLYFNQTDFVHCISNKCSDLN